MVYKIGTFQHLDAYKGSLSPIVYEAVLPLVQMLDLHYGSTRNIDIDDGGYILYIDTATELDNVEELPFDYRQHPPEEVSFIDPDGIYINAFFLIHNDFGINIIVPTKQAPVSFITELEVL